MTDLDRDAGITDEHESREAVSGDTASRIFTIFLLYAKRMGNMLLLLISVGRSRTALAMAAVYVALLFEIYLFIVRIKHFVLQIGQ